MWWCGNAGHTMHPAGEKQANALGLFDMHGNVWEWVADRYGSYSDGAQTDPLGPSSGATRVFRGGGWNDGAHYCRSAPRESFAPTFRFYIIGFRLAQAP